MNIPMNMNLYNKVKEQADKIYKKPSAYKSGYIVKKYKELGGTYSGKKTSSGLTSWYREKWTDIGNKRSDGRNASGKPFGQSLYPVYRPTKRVNKKTPLLVSEIDPKNLKTQIALKQIYKGKKNLPPFENASRFALK